MENTVDWDPTIREIVAFIKKTVKEARADGVVVGLEDLGSEIRLTSSASKLVALTTTRD